MENNVNQNMDESVERADESPRKIDGQEGVDVVAAVAERHLREVVGPDAAAPGPRSAPTSHGRVGADARRPA